MKKILVIMMFLFLAGGFAFAVGDFEQIDIVDDFGDVTGTGYKFMADPVKSSYYLTLTCTPQYGVFFDFFDGNFNSADYSYSSVSMKIGDEVISFDLYPNQAANNSDVVGYSLVADTDLARTIVQAVNDDTKISISVKPSYGSAMTFRLVSRADVLKVLTDPESGVDAAEKWNELYEAFMSQY